MLQLPLQNSKTASCFTQNQVFDCAWSQINRVYNPLITK